MSFAIWSRSCHRILTTFLRQSSSATRHACYELHAETLSAHTAKYQVAVGTRCQNVKSLALHDRNFHDEMDNNTLSCRVSNRPHTFQIIMVSKITMPPAVFKLCAGVPCFLPRTLPLMLLTYHCQHRNITEAAVAAKRVPCKGGRSPRSSCTQESF